MLFVSHNMAAISELDPRGLFCCNAGRIVFDGPVPDATARYLLKGI